MERLGRYALLRPFTGARERWLGFDPTLDRTVVIELTQGHEDIESLLARGRSFAALDDPALAAVHDISVIDDRVVLAREHIDGVPLSGWSPSTRSWKTVVAVLVPIVRAVARIHAAGLHVGNLTADGICVGEDGLARLTAPILDAGAGTQAGDREALCRILGQTLRGAGIAPPRHLAELEGCSFGTTEALLARLSVDPGQRRRRALVVIGVCCIGGVAVAAFFGAKSAARDACLDGARQLAAVWDEAARARLHSALVSTRTPFAENVAASLIRALDRYGHAWIAAHGEACEAARAGSSDEGEEMAWKTCLEGKLDAMAALLGVLEQADATVVQNALDTARALDPAADCLEARTSPARYSEERRALRRDLARAKVLQRAGKYEEALVSVREVSAAADHRGDDETSLEALQLQGVLQWQRGDASTADGMLEESVGLAWTADRDDLAARAWGQLVYVRAEMLGDFARARRAAHHAEATLVRLGDVPDIEADIRKSLGTLAQREGRHDDAIDSYTTALQAYIRAGADEDEQAGILVNLANAYLLADDLEQALGNQQTALAISRRILGDEHPDTALVRETGAVILLQKGEAESALAELRMVHEIRNRALGAEHPLTIKALGNVGAALSETSRWDEAEQVLLRTLVDTRRLFGPRDPNIFFLLANLAVVERARKRPAAALRYCEEAAQTHEEMPDHPNVAKALRCQAQALLELDQLGEAIARHRQALQILESRLGPDHELVARSLGDLGGALLEKPDDPAARTEARSHLLRALEIHRRRGSPEPLIEAIRAALAGAGKSLDQKFSPGGTASREGPEGPSK